MKERIKDNKEKIKMNKQLPYLVGNVVEVRTNRQLLFCYTYKQACIHYQLLDIDPEEEEEEGANVDLDSRRKGKCAVIKTSTRQVSIHCLILRIYVFLTMVS